MCSCGRSEGCSNAGTGCWHHADSSQVRMCAGTNAAAGPSIAVLPRGASVDTGLVGDPGGDA
eukprot:12149455-Alexandrium_andersonii.AAC.1